MNTLKEKTIVYEPVARKIVLKNDLLCLFLTDGREIRVPLEFYPRIKKATKKQREHCEIFGNGTSIHWPEIDEDLSVEGVVEGLPSRF